MHTPLRKEMNSGLPGCIGLMKLASKATLMAMLQHMQSVMRSLLQLVLATREPAAYGATVLFGPNTWNFREIVEQLLTREAAREQYGVVLGKDLAVDDAATSAERASRATRDALPA